VWEFQGAELDLAVAQAAGMDGPRIVEGVCTITASPDHRSERVRYCPSASWADGGPIIEGHTISLWRYPDLDSWHACTHFDFARDEGLKIKNYCQGPTPLVAAMRTFLASKTWKDT
jgi:hypothetical protein